MKNLFTLFAIAVLFISTTTAQELPGFQGSVNVGYVSDVVDFGKVTSTDQYVVGVDVSWQSFSLGVATYSDLKVAPFDGKLNRVDLTGGYTFFSTLADLEVGTSYVHKNGLNRNTFSGNWQPFVSVGKGFYKLTGTYDVQTRMTDVELDLHKAINVAGDLNVVPGVFLGYSDVNDALPKAVREIKYTNAYYGGSVDLNWKWFNVGGFAVRDGNLKDTEIGWRASATLKF